MIPIIEEFSKSRLELDILCIQTASKACVSDTYEVLQMIQYLTQFGKIERTKEGWTRSKQLKYSEPIPRRLSYLDALLKIIYSLSELPVTVIQISRNLRMDSDALLLCLNFLEKISSIGIINKIRRADQYKWYIKQYAGKKILSTYSAT